MADENLGLINSDISVPDATNNDVPAPLENSGVGQEQVQAPAIAQENPQEKLLKQSEVNEIVGLVRKEAAERGRREALAELQKTQTVNEDQGSRGLDLNDERIRKIVSEENEKAANQAVANKIAMDFTQKMLSAKSKYPDFEQVVSQLDLPRVPEIVHWTNSLDNTADVMYDIAKNPSKFANILMLTQAAPHLAQAELQKLSSSIKKNQEAQAQAQPKEPLSQIKASSAGTDNGKMTLQDYKNADWLRG